VPGVALEGWAVRGGAARSAYDSAMGGFVYMLRCSDKSL
jgi:hypothetical protein